jgi:glucose-6-phosphate 1-epimerase
MNSTVDTFQGHAGWRWSLPNGDSVFVAEQGAHVLSWQAAGKERLFLSSTSVCDGVTAIRGGIPVCFPQFNQRGTLPKHGFARNMPWRCVPDLSQGDVRVFELSTQAATLTLWPYHFKARLTVMLAPGQLKVTLSVENQGEQPLSFTGALHTYFAVDHLDQVRLLGQAQQPEWDAVRDTHQNCAGTLQFDAEFDRVYDVQTQTEPTWTLQDGPASLHISQSESWGQSVVWNPGAEKCAQLKDMPPQGYQHMVCVEAARVTSSIDVLPAQTWVGWQQLSLSSSC